MMKIRRYFTWKRDNSFPLYSYASSKIICWKISDHEFLYHRIIYNDYSRDNEYCLVDVDTNEFKFVDRDNFFDIIPQGVESKFFEGLSYADDKAGISITIFALSANSGFAIVESADYIKSINSLAEEMTAREVFDKFLA